MKLSMLIVALLLASIFLVLLPLTSATANTNATEDETTSIHYTNSDFIKSHRKLLVDLGYAKQMVPLPVNSTDPFFESIQSPENVEALAKLTNFSTMGHIQPRLYEKFQLENGTGYRLNCSQKEAGWIEEKLISDITYIFVTNLFAFSYEANTDLVCYLLRPTDEFVACASPTNREREPFALVPSINGMEVGEYCKELPAAKEIKPWWVEHYILMAYLIGFTFCILFWGCYCTGMSLIRWRRRRGWRNGTTTRQDGDTTVVVFDRNNQDTEMTVVE